MADLFSGIRDRVRFFMRGDRDSRIVQAAQGNTASTLPASSYDLLQNYGYDLIADYLRVEQDLMSRFLDYEGMDDYPETSAALNIYADDSTQPDTPTNKRVWIESKDRDIQLLLNDLLHRTLRIEDDLWSISRGTCKYGNCIREGSRVWTESGPLAIEQVEPGTRVFGYKDGELALFTVRKRHANGVQQTYRVRTRHREVLATANHPLLVQDADGSTRWVEVRDLEVLRYPPSSGRGTGGLRPENPRLVVSQFRLFPEDVPSWDTLLGPVVERPWGDKGSPRDLALPDSMPSWLSRLLGFLWGDGFLGSEDPYSTSTSVFYARGEYGEQNDYYDALLTRLGAEPRLSDDGAYTVVSSVRLKDLLLRLEWRNGASDKRLPSWLGRLPREHQEEFLRGFLDADGWTSAPRTWTRTAHHFEIANVPLAYDLKALVDGLGYRSGHVRVRHRQPGFEINGKVVKSTQPTGMLTFSFLRAADEFAAENLLSVEPLDASPVYDLEVDDAAHNFVVEGVVVHNSYEEIIVGEDGVIGLNHLPAHTVRRVEGPRGELYGFVQDFKRRMGYSPREFQQLLAKRAASNLSGSNRAPNEWDAAVNDVTASAIPFEPWQVVHMRLRSKYRKSVYGYCLAGDSRVWTCEGPKAIEDVRAGDRVLLRHSGLLRTTKVLDQVCSGVKPLFRLRTKHRELRLTAEHPVLRRGEAANQWVQVKDLSLGDNICVATNMPQVAGPPAFGLELLREDEQSQVRLTQRGTSALRERTRVSPYMPKDEGLRPVAAQFGITRGKLEELLEGRSSVTKVEARALFEAVGLPFFEGATALSVDARLTLPDFITPKVARLWGFLLGDGWLTDRQLYFALGVDEDQNCFYEGLLRELGLEVSRLEDAEGVDRQAYVSSTVLVALMRRLGWTDGAHAKRVPSWVYTGSRELREEFLQGFQDADGWETQQGPEPYYHIELCNEALLRDLKNLIDGLGWTSGNIRERGPRESTYRGKVIRSGESYLLYYRKAVLSGEDFLFEAVEAIDADGEGPVYDIEVADREHNFVAEGLVVHNSVYEPARWVWKRLVLLEDAALIYRLQRAAERYAFYINTGTLPYNEAIRLVNFVRHQFKKKKFVNPRTGEIDLKLNTLAQDEDFFIPSPEGNDSTRIDVLSSPSWQHMEDIEYFKRKMFSAMLIPRAYLSEEEGVNRAILSSEDVRFARTILRVQREMKHGIEKICRVHLAAIGIPPEAVEFDARFTVPSAIFELAQMEVRNARADLADRLRTQMSHRYVLRNVFNLSDDEIEATFAERLEDSKREGKQQGIMEKAQQQAGPEEPEGGGGDDDKGGEPIPAVPRPDTTPRTRPQVVQQPRADRPEPGELGKEKESRLYSGRGWTRPYLIRQNRSGNSERELLADGSHDREMTARMQRLLQGNTRLSRDLREIRGMLTDLRHLVPRR